MGNGLLRETALGAQAPQDRGEHQIDWRHRARSLWPPEEARAIVATALFTGLRMMEVLGLVWGDVDFAAGQAMFATSSAQGVSVCR